MPSLRRLEIVLGDWEGQDPPPGFQQPSRAEQSFREVEKALMDGPLAGGVEHVTFVVPRKSTAGTPSFWAVRLRETFPRLEEKVLLKIWTDPGQCTATLRKPSNELIDPTDTLISTNCHVKHVEALTFSNTGQHLATMALDDVALWDVKTNTAVARFMRNADGSPGSSTGQEIAFSPNASRLAVVAGYKHITLQDVSSADSADVLELPWREIGTVVCCQWSLDGTKLAVGSRWGIICLWQDAGAFRDRLILRPPGAGRIVSFISFSSDNRLLVVVHKSLKDQSWRVWEVATGHLVRTMEPPHGCDILSVAFHLKPTTWLLAAAI
ncbi:WD40 repeat-like protein [Dichomitus squalens LYAD-421 SS1]|uniref:WD40 repeat-like protein n=1 Tax=Dichomitus squalens (strain LYAD-421) TaxID=732165 RepID=UPI0004412CD6|nr:WD40 repeat-like protein [Dichomitus squalens LYAD-421 SS1]EJF64116.1 WD40 repeat-like protein [Dichomitus squalens LYAD-421 SS1]